MESRLNISSLVGCVINMRLSLKRKVVIKTMTFHSHAVQSRSVFSKEYLINMKLLARILAIYCECTDRVHDYGKFRDK